MLRMQLEKHDSAALPAILKARARERLDRLRKQKKLWPHDYPTYARDNLKIRPKDPLTGSVSALRNLDLNNVQFGLEASLDNQLAEIGQVRAIVEKARQLGISTDISGRFYHRVRYTPGIRALIMTHRDDATRNLMGMIKRFHEHDSDPLKVVRDNATEFIFENDSGFVVQTAGAVSTGAGRSFTYQLAHLSELAFWQNASDHLTAVLDAVPDTPGSEVIIESTANGAAGPFYAMAMAAQAGIGRYQLMFFPWFEHEEYAMDAARRLGAGPGGARAWPTAST